MDKKDQMLNISDVEVTSGELPFFIEKLPNQSPALIEEKPNPRT